jgi:hypothetical protein
MICVHEWGLDCGCVCIGWGFGGIDMAEDRPEHVASCPEEVDKAAMMTGF